MGNAIGQVLPFAIVAALSPLPIVAVVLMLATTRSRINGPMFIVGWLVGFALVGVIVLAIAGPTNASSNSTGTDWVNWLKLLLGLALFRVALKQLRGRPHGDEEPPTPKWMGTVDEFTPIKAAGAGVVLSAVNPKNLLIAVAAATSIAQTGISGADQAIAYAVFTLVATLGVAIPVGLFFALGERSRDTLDGLKKWMIHNNAVIMAVICAVIGAKLIGDAISGFSA